MNKLSLLSLFLLAFCFTLGCSDVKRPEGLPKLYPCSLTFTQEGKPMEGAVITLVSSDPDFRWTIGGIANPSGTAKIMTHGQYPGVPEGEYRVLIRKVEEEEVNSFKEIDPDTGKEMITGGVIKVYTTVDKDYTDLEKTPIKITIEKRKYSEAFECGKPIRELLTTTRL